MTKNRVCLTCGNEYEYCRSCPSGSKLPIWKSLFDTENCKKIFETVSDYAQTAISKERALERLSDCDLSNAETLKPTIKNLIKEITTEVKTEPTSVEVEETVAVKAKTSNRRKRSDENKD